MSGVNRVILIGNLGQDAEVRHTQQGTAVATLNLAVNEVWNDRDGNKHERVEWVRVVWFGKGAEALKRYLLKGKQLYVEGKMQTRKYEKDGVDRYITEVIADQVTLLASSKSRHPSEQDIEEPVY